MDVFITSKGIGRGCSSSPNPTLEPLHVQTLGIKLVLMLWWFALAAMDLTEESIPQDKSVSL